MENIENEEKNVLDKINTSNEPPSTKPKKKKKKIKKQKEKKCNGLKELLEQINQEKLEKIKKAQEKKEKEIKIHVKENSQIQTSTNIIQNENEEKNKDLIKDYINIFNNSVSRTTTTLSHDDFNELQKINFDKNSENSNKIKNLEISEDEKIEEEQQFYKKRKISSPICDYYDGCDKYLSETHKGSIDMTNSMNFIKKEDFFPFGCCYINNNNIYNNNNYNIINNNNNDSNNYINPEVNNHNNINNNNEQNDNNNSINDEKTNNNSNNDNNIDNNNIDNNDELEQIEFDKKNININNINIFNEEYDYINNYMNNMNIPYSQFMDYYYNQTTDNFISKFTLLNDFNIKNKYKSFYKYNKQFKKSKNTTNHFNKKMPTRKGDWLCNICYNLNFSFRNFCNRCKAPKQ